MPKKRDKKPKEEQSKEESCDIEKLSPEEYTKLLIFSINASLYLNGVTFREDIFQRLIDDFVHIANNVPMELVNQWLEEREKQIKDFEDRIFEKLPVAGEA